MYNTFGGRDSTHGKVSLTSQESKPKSGKDDKLDKYEKKLQARQTQFELI